MKRMIIPTWGFAVFSILTLLIIGFIDWLQLSGDKEWGEFLTW